MCSGERYNPATNSWTQIPDMYNPRSNFAIEVIDDMIFAIGGFNGVTTIYHVECYDERTNEWYVIPVFTQLHSCMDYDECFVSFIPGHYRYEATDMNIYRSALSACVIMGLPNVYDYIHKHRERLMEEKRQKLLALEVQRTQQQQQHQNDNNQIPPPPPLAQINHDNNNQI